jgi:hypothetical protein
MLFDNGFTLHAAQNLFKPLEDQTGIVNNTPSPDDERHTDSILDNERRDVWNCNLGWTHLRNLSKQSGPGV